MSPHDGTAPLDKYTVHIFEVGFTTELEGKLDQATVKVVKALTAHKQERVGLIVHQCNTTSVLFQGLIEHDWDFSEFDEPGEVSCQWAIYNRSLGPGEDDVYWLVFEHKDHRDHFAELFKEGRSLAQRNKDEEHAMLGRMFAVVACLPTILGIEEKAEEVL